MFIIPNSLQKSKTMRETQEKQQEKYTNLIKDESFFSLNEIEISQRILKIPGYSMYFNPILRNSYINLAEVDMNCFNEPLSKSYSETEDNIPRYFLIKQLNVSNLLTFYQVFYESKRENPKKYLLTIINNYKHLLTTIKYLEENKLVNLEYHPSTLLFRNNLIVLTNLSKFFHFPTMNKERISYQFSSYQPKNIFLPPEAHIICFLIEKKQESISATNIDDISLAYTAGISALSCFSNDFIEQLKEKTRFSLQSFINKPKSIIINEVLLISTSWNNYGLSILFLVLLRDIFRHLGFSQNAFILKFSQLLTQNIHPNPSERITPIRNISLFNDILYNTDRSDFLQLFCKLKG